MKLNSAYQVLLLDLIRLVTISIETVLLKNSWLCHWSFERDNVLPNLTPRVLFDISYQSSIPGWKDVVEERKGDTIVPKHPLVPNLGALRRLCGDLTYHTDVLRRP